ncbi:MAG: bifunctional 3-(3-hydroxy-phenyl)propionate/3-hydroxycinnamic acid hydroxylase [Mycobacterium sp.]
MSPSAQTVVIVGAGPTGVTAATLLAQYGVQTTVLDRWSGVYPQPRAVHLDDEVYRILDRLKVADAFATISRPALGLRLIDPRMRVLATFHRDPNQRRNGYPSANMFDQPELEALLRDNLAHHPAVTLRGNVEVTDIADAGDGRTRVTFTDRSEGTEQILYADYLLGCDGANSLVRTRIGAQMKDLNFEQRWLVIDVASAAELGQWDGVHQLCDSRRAGTFMRIGPNRYRWEFRLLDGETAEDFHDMDTLGPLIAPWTTRVDESRLEIIRVADYTFRAKLADHWRRGNIFLLGDAAHLTPPFVGQGLCAGMRDAMNLSWKLAGVLNGHLDPSVLDTYEQERKPHARSMIQLALMVGRAMTSGGSAGDLLRGIVVPRMQLLPGLRRRVLDSETPALSRSALVRGPGPLPGTLCPNPQTPDGRHLDTVLGSGFAIVASRELPGADRAEALRRGAAVYVAEPGSEVAAWLRGGRATAAILRPDRTVMAAGRDISHLCAALPSFG